MFVRIGWVHNFEQGQIVPVYEQPPDDEHVIRSEADFDIHWLAEKQRQWQKGGMSEEEFRAIVREAFPIYAEVGFPGKRTWLLREEAEALIEEGLAEPIETVDAKLLKDFSQWLEGLAAEDFRTGSDRAFEDRVTGERFEIVTLELFHNETASVTARPSAPAPAK